MFRNKRIVPWAFPTEFRNVACCLTDHDQSSLRLAFYRIQTWLAKCSATHVPRSVPCTYELLLAYFEGSSQSLALAIMRFISLISNESNRLYKDRVAVPAYSLVKRADLPNWMADMRNDIAHNNVPRRELLDLGLKWCLSRVKEFWTINLVEQPASSSYDKMFHDVYNHCWQYSKEKISLETVMFNKPIVSFDYYLTEDFWTIMSNFVNRLPNFFSYLKSKEIVLFSAQLFMTRDLLKALIPVFNIFRKHECFNFFIEMLFLHLIERDGSCDDYFHLCSSMVEYRKSEILSEYFTGVNWHVVLDILMRVNEAYTDVLFPGVLNCIDSANSDLKSIEFLDLVKGRTQGALLSQELDIYKVMPKQVTGIKDFLHKTHRPDAKSVIIKNNKNNVKFKIRCSRFLYTLIVEERDKVNKIRQALPPNLTVKEIK